jgi:hypothetical protein
MAEISQVFTVEYLVPGSLDGVTPSPGFSVDRARSNSKNADSDGVFRFSAAEMTALTGGNLGLIDLTTPFDGNQNLFANRLVTWFFLDAPGAPGGGGAAVDSVDIRDGVATRQVLHATLTGNEDFFGTAFFVPQGSRLRVNGFTAAAQPILVRLNVNFFETVEELLLAVNQIQEEFIGAQFSAFLSVNTAIPGFATTPMPLDVLDFPFDPELYTHVLGDPDIIILQSGRYQVAADITIDTTLARTTERVSLFVDDGTGFIAIKGGISYGSSDDNNTIPLSKTFLMDAGDIMQIGTVRIAGLGALSYVGAACRLAITKVPKI